MKISDERLQELIEMLDALSEVDRTNDFGDVSTALRDLAACRAEIRDVTDAYVSRFNTGHGLIGPIDTEIESALAFLAKPQGEP